MSAMTAPLAPPRPCPEEFLPSSLKGAIKAAEASGWDTTVTFAMGPGPEFISSVVFRAHRGEIWLVTRHESKLGPRQGMGFVSAFRHPGPFDIPLRLGWREVLAELRTMHG